MDDVSVTFTSRQAEVLHEVLSMVTNDPDWSELLGSARDFATLTRAHARLMGAKR